MFINLDFEISQLPPFGQLKVPCSQLHFTVSICAVLFARALAVLTTQNKFTWVKCRSVSNLLKLLHTVIPCYKDVRYDFVAICLHALKLYKHEFPFVSLPACFTNRFYTYASSSSITMMGIIDTQKLTFVRFSVRGWRRLIQNRRSTNGGYGISI